LEAIRVAVQVLAVMGLLGLTKAQIAEARRDNVQPTGGGGFNLVFGLGRSPFGGSAGNSPTWRSCVALLFIAKGRRCNRLAICEAEFVGHKVTSSRSSSSVQRDMTGLGHPAPGAMPADSCGIILAHLSARAARLKRSVEPCHFASSMASAAGPSPDFGGALGIPRETQSVRQLFAMQPLHFSI
jgi:hypothetical protein